MAKIDKLSFEKNTRVLHVFKSVSETVDDFERQVSELESDLKKATPDTESQKIAEVKKLEKKISDYLEKESVGLDNVGKSDLRQMMQVQEWVRLLDKKAG